MIIMMIIIIMKIIMIIMIQPTFLSSTQEGDLDPLPSGPNSSSDAGECEAGEYTGGSPVVMDRGQWPCNRNPNWRYLP